MIDDEDYFLTSLNDTLTCGLGACIVLFVVFVILVTIQEPVRGEGRQRTVSDDVTAPASGEERARGRAPVMVRVRGECGFIRTVTADDSDTRVFVDRRNGKNREKCVALIHYERPPEHGTVPIVARSVPSGHLVLTATWGGQRLTGERGVERRWPRAELEITGKTVFATVRLHDEDNPVQWER